MLVTGAASGIGEAAARRFGREGAILALADKGEDALNKVTGGIEAADALAVVADLSNADRCRDVVAQAVSRFGRLDVLVNNAGKDHLGLVDEGDIADFSTIIETDLYGVFYSSTCRGPIICVDPRLTTAVNHLVNAAATAEF